MARLIDLFDASFNPDEVEASRQMDPIPDGDYVMHVTKTELNLTKYNNGHRLDVEFTIIEGQHTDRKLFTSLNVRNANQQAEQIALRDLKALSDACGLDFNMVLDDSDNLLFQPFRGHVVYAQDMVKNALGTKEPKRNPETGQPYGPRNRITRFHSLSDASPAPAPQQAAPAAVARPAARPAQAPAATQRPAPQGATNPFGQRR